MAQSSTQRFRRRSNAVLVGALLAAFGCGDSGVPAVPSSTEEATVHGKVTLDGKPPTSGTVSFNPANIARRDAKTASAPIDKDGSYTVKTLVGENAIAVESAETKGTMYSRETFDVKSGDNSHDIALTKIR